MKCKEEFTFTDEILMKMRTTATPWNKGYIVEGGHIKDHVRCVRLC